MKPILLIATIFLSTLSLFGADTIIPPGSDWKYLDSGVDQGTDWRGSAYEDSDWNSGPAQLGFGDGDEATVISRIGLDGQPLITAYFRKKFTVPDPSIYSTIVLRLLRDDGGIVYLNGVEVLRSSMSTFTNAVINYFSLATIAAEGASETNFFSRVGPASILRVGENILAVEVHQVSLTSSDMSFDFMLLGNLTAQNTAPVANQQTVTALRDAIRSITLTGSDADGDPLSFSIVDAPSHGALGGIPPAVTYTPASGYTGPDSFTFKVNDGKVDSATATVVINVIDPPPPPTALLVPSNSVWRFLDTGIDPGADWRGLGYDDSNWASGPAQLGFGDGDEATTISNRGVGGEPIVTAYFRRSFVVSNALQTANLALSLWRDDGAIVYVNGVQVLRDNMPFGPVNYFTLASANASDDGNARITATAPAGMLVFGLNVVAVEVHQVNLVSSDISFDLELRGVPGSVSNRPPVATSQSLTVAEDAPLAITLQGSDPDNNLLFFTYTQPAHGLVVGDAPNLAYQPASEFSGADSFNFTIFDGRGGLAQGTVDITVTSVNDAPVAVARAASAADPQNFVRDLLVVAKNNTDAGVILDGSGSADVDSSSLTYAWYLNNSPRPFSTEPVFTGPLAVGSHIVTLVVSDGTAAANDTINVYVLTPCDMVELLEAHLDAPSLEKNQAKQLGASLKLACSAFDSGNILSGIRYLMHFQARINSKIIRDNPELGALLIQAAQDIIDAVR